MVVRDKLNRVLYESACEYPVTLISAPAGYGKTTLMSALCHTHDELTTAWLSLDVDDNDPVLFMVDLLAALERAAPKCTSTSQGLLESLSYPAVEIQRLVSVLINDMLISGIDPLILVMDDLHVIQEASVIKALNYLIDHIPENVHLVMASRYDPALALPRLRARGQLAEFRSTDLRFSHQEVRSLLNNNLGFDLSAELISDLEMRTEGWAALLHLLTASMDRLSTAKEREAYIRSLPNAERNVFDFLADEVLNLQEPKLRKFLLETGILRALNPNLCIAVTGQQNAAEILENLYQRNLLFIAVESSDPTDTCYRYHDLFAEFLRQRLLREYTRENIHQLHVRAAKAQPGSQFEISHYLRAEKWDDAAKAIQEIGQKMLNLGLFDSLRNWIDALPQNIVENYAQLDYILGVSAFQRGEFEKAQWFTERALNKFTALGDEINEGSAILILGAIASGLHEVEPAGAYLEKALSYPLSPNLQIMAHMNRAWVGVYSNDWEMVGEDVEMATQMALRLEEQSAFNVIAPHLTAALLFMPNGVSRLKTYCSQVLSWFGDQTQQVQVGANALMGVIYIMEGKLEKGGQALDRARGDSDRLGGFVWLDISIDFGILHHALIEAEYGKFEQYWQSRLMHYESVSGAREYLTNFLYIQGRAFWQKNRIQEAREIYARMMAIETSQNIPENQLARALMGAMLLISEKKYPQAEGILLQVAKLQKQAPHSVLFGNARVLLAVLYLQWGQPEAALTELRTILSEYERRNMVGLLLFESANITPILRLAIEKGVCLKQVNWLLGIFYREHKFQPMLIRTTGETLTKREVEVLSLIIEGMTNREIAGSLVISETTVKSHVSSIFRKLSVQSRTQAVSRARDLYLFK